MLSRASNLSSALELQEGNRFPDSGCWLNVSVAIPANLIGESMRYDRRLILGPALLLAALVLSACSGSGQANSGVARVDDSKVVKPPIKSAGPSNPKSDTPVKSTSEADTSDGNTNADEPTDEEITTNFTVCMRDHGLDVPDPELNADGSIDWEDIKQAINQDPKSNKSSKALEECLPLLEGATFSEKKAPEDEIELQDDLLAFAQCLRDEGIDVLDPDFSGDPRAGMADVKQALKRANAKVERGFDLCNELVFGAGKSGQ